jgi:hypothetical protein
MITFDKGRSAVFSAGLARAGVRSPIAQRKMTMLTRTSRIPPLGKVRLRKHNSAKSPVCASAAISSRDSILNWGVQFGRACVSLVGPPADRRNNGAHEKNRESDSNEKHEDD